MSFSRTVAVCLCSSEVNFNIWLENTKWPKCHHKNMMLHWRWYITRQKNTHRVRYIWNKFILFVMLTLTELLSCSPHSLLCAFMKSDQIPETWLRSFTDPSLNVFPVWVRSESHLPPGLPNRNLQGKTGNLSVNYWTCQFNNLLFPLVWDTPRSHIIHIYFSS